MLVTLFKTFKIILRIKMMDLLQNINSVTYKLIPLFILINFILLLFLIYSNRDHIKKLFSRINKKTWLILFLIFIAGFVLRFFLITHYHVMYTDEQEYMEAGKNLLLDNEQGNYFRSIGWPFILRISLDYLG